MSPATTSTVSEGVNEIAIIRIGLCDTDPLIWHEVEAPTSIALMVPHDIAKTVMGWFDCHLWEFTIDLQRYGLPLDEYWGTEPSIRASKARLSEVLEPRRTLIDYTHDMGDCWEHRLTVTDVRACQPELHYPRYIGGEQDGPPEDCRGIPGFFDMLDAIAYPGHRTHAEAKQRAKDYDLGAVDEMPINYALARIANRPNAAKAHLARKSKPGQPHLTRRNQPAAITKGSRYMRQAVSDD